MRQDSRIGNTTSRGRALPKLRPSLSDTDLFIVLKRLERIAHIGEQESVVLKDLQTLLRELKKTQGLLYKVFQDLSASLKEERLTAIETQAAALDHKFMNQKRKNQDNGR